MHMQWILKWQNDVPQFFLYLKTTERETVAGIGLTDAGIMEKPAPWLYASWNIWQAFYYVAAVAGNRPL